MDRATLVSVDEYLDTGHVPGGIRECSDGVLCSSDGSIEVPLSELFG